MLGHSRKHRVVLWRELRMTGEYAEEGDNGAAAYSHETLLECRLELVRETKPKAPALSTPGPGSSSASWQWTSPLPAPGPRDTSTQVMQPPPWRPVIGSWASSQAKWRVLEGADAGDGEGRLWGAGAFLPFLASVNVWDSFILDSLRPSLRELTPADILSPLRFIPFFSNSTGRTATVARA